VVAVAVQVLHLALVEGRALDVLFRPQLLVGEGHRPDVAHADLDVCAFVAGREVMQLEDAVQVVSALDEHAFTESRRLNG
jgi:hypothetical protein